MAADAVLAERIPRTLRQKITLIGGLTVLVGFLAAGGWVGWKWWSQHRQDQMLARALQEVSADGLKPKLGKDANGLPDAEIHRAAGEYQLRSGKPECVNDAVKHFGFARTLLILSPASSERSALLIDLALAQVDLAGDDADVQKKVRLPWDATQGQLQETLTHLMNRPPEEVNRDAKSSERSARLRLTATRSLRSGARFMTNGGHPRHS